MNDTLNDSVDERLSALCDDQLAGDELTQTIDALVANNDLQGQWARMNLIGAALRPDGIAMVDGEFASRVASAIELDANTHEEPVIDEKVIPIARGRSTKSPGQRRRYLPVGLAVAASAAVAALVLTLQPGSFSDSPDNTMVVDAPDSQLQNVQALAAVELPNAGSVENSVNSNRDNARSSAQTEPRAVSHTALVSSETARRINGFMINHSAYQGGAGFSGTMGYARVTAYDASYRPESR